MRASSTNSGSAYENLAVDHGGALVYLAPSRVNLQLTLERWPGVTFPETREHATAAAGVRSKGAGAVARGRNLKAENR